MYLSMLYVNKYVLNVWDIHLVTHSHCEAPWVRAVISVSGCVSGGTCIDSLIDFPVMAGDSPVPLVLSQPSRFPPWPSLAFPVPLPCILGLPYRACSPSRAWRHTLLSPPSHRVLVPLLAVALAVAVCYDGSDLLCANRPPPTRPPPYCPCRCPTSAHSIRFGALKRILSPQQAAMAFNS